MNKSVMKCCICNNENIGQFITINNKKYHLCCIKQLQQENQKQKEAINKAIEILKLCNSQCAKETIDILKEVLE